MDDDISGPVGPVDYPTLRQIRDFFLDAEPLATDASFDDPANPTELLVEFSVGYDAPGRLEITWWQRGGYRYHYTEPDGIDFRFDNHPKETAPDAHFHPPPDAGTARPSILADAHRPQVVTRAVLDRWRAAVVDGQGLEALDGELD